MLQSVISRLILLRFSTLHFFVLVPCSEFLRFVPNNNSFNALFLNESKMFFSIFDESSIGAYFSLKRSFGTFRNAGENNFAKEMTYKQLIGVTTKHPGVEKSQRESRW